MNVQIYLICFLRFSQLSVNLHLSIIHGSNMSDELMLLESTKAQALSSTEIFGIVVVCLGVYL